MIDAGRPKASPDWQGEDGAGHPGRLICRNIRVGDRRTAMRLEPLYWTCLEEIARLEAVDLAVLLGAVYRKKAPRASLTAATRGFVVAYYRALARGLGHFPEG